MVTIVALSVGLTYVTVSGVTEVTIDKVATGSLMTGNVQVRVMDEDGDIMAYRQSDNHITVTGLEILTSQLFNDTRTKAVGAGGASYNDVESWKNFTDYVVTGAAPKVPGSGTGGTIKFMNIGNGTAPLLHDDRKLDAQIDDSTVRLFGAGGCDRIVANIRNSTEPFVNGTTGFDRARQIPSHANLAQINVTAVATFDGAQCFATIIHEAGIWTDLNNTGGNDAPGTNSAGWMFARNTFGNVDLTVNDSLELTWTFTFTDS
jgi:hypothetical protein